MKRFIKILILFISINTSLLVIHEKANAQTVSFQVFYDDLSPYGNWIESPDYGYVWCPRNAGFIPYSTNGYWVYTDVGWTWVSDYSWGWAPFHYGRWYDDPVYGYVWVPGYEWGPGWVTWRRSDDYYGWAPIGPGVNISLAYSNGYNLPYNQWNFVRCNEFGRRDIRNYYIDRSKNVTIINNTTVINTTKVDNIRKTAFTPGPERAEVQRKAGRNITPVAIVDEKKPVQHVTKDNVQLYRPIVEKNNNEKRPAPARITTPDEMKAQVNTRREQTNKNNDQRNELNQPNKQIRDERPKPVMKQPVKPGEKDNNPDKQQPVRQQPQRREIKNEQPDQPVRQQRVKEQPQQPDRQKNNQPGQQRPEQKQQPQPVQPAKEQPQQKPGKQRNEQPAQQRPERQRNMDLPMRQERPQPNVNRPQQQRPMQQPPRQMPSQPRPQREKNGG